MNVFGLNAEVFVGDNFEPAIDEAQESANTQTENQDDDPDTSEDEKARIWKMIGMTGRE